MIGKVLLGSTALAGIAVCALPVSAGQLGSRDSLQVTLRGELRFSTGFSDQDVSATSGRGYTFRVDESEIRMIARNNAENGLEYGVSIELLTGAGDSAGADEAFAFVDSEAWGRVEMGDQDDAFDRMHVAAHDILVGRAGADGDPGDFFAFGTGDAIDSPGVDSTSDDTKITYFTPRVAGFQFGSSLTPDSGQTSKKGSRRRTAASAVMRALITPSVRHTGQGRGASVWAGLKAASPTPRAAAPTPMSPSFLSTRPMMWRRAGS